MKTTLSIFFFTLVFALLGALVIAFALQLVDLGLVSAMLTNAYHDFQTRAILGVCGLVFIFLSLAAAQIITGKIQREKTIAFSNPNGQVTVTLSAVEDLIKRLAREFAEIKDSKAVVKATKKGIDIGMRVVLRFETNIPDFTLRLQDLIAVKIQEIFGIDEPVVVKIHVSKIVGSEEKSKLRAQNQQEAVSIPYHGMKI